MAEPETPDQKADPTTNRWWVDSSAKERAKPQPAPAAVAGAKFFRAAQGFAQEPARDRLTDNNLKIVRQASPPEGEWVYVKLGDSAFSEKERERIKREVALPPYARALSRRTRSRPA